MPESASRGGGCLLQGGVCWGGVCSGGSALGGLLWGMSGWGVSALGGRSVLGGCLLWGYPNMHWGRPPPPLYTESQTPVKTLPWPNFVVAGKNGCESQKQWCDIVLVVCSHCLTPRPIKRPIKNGLYRIVWRSSYCTDTDTNTDSHQILL